MSDNFENDEILSEEESAVEEAGVITEDDAIEEDYVDDFDYVSSADDYEESETVSKKASKSYGSSSRSAAQMAILGKQNLIVIFIAFLLAFILGGVVFGLFNYFSNKKSTPKNLFENSGKLTSDECYDVFSVIQAEKQYAVYSEMAQSSALYAIDSNAISTVELSFLLDVPPLTKSINGGTIPVTLSVSGNNVTRDIDVIYNIDVLDEVLTGALVSAYMAEATGVGMENAAGDVLVFAEAETAEGAGNILTITLMGATEDQVNAQADKVIEYLQGISEGFVSTVGAHELTLIASEYAVVSDLDILDKQNAMSDKLLEYSCKVLKKESFTAEQLEYYTYLTTNNISVENLIAGAFTTEDGSAENSADAGATENSVDESENGGDAEGVEK